MAITHTTSATGGDSAGLIGQTQWNEAHTGIAGDGGFSFKYAFDTGTSGTPSTGTLQLSNATPSSAATLYIHETDATGTGIDSVIDLIRNTDFIMLSNSDRSKFHVFQVNGQFISGANVDPIPVAWMSGTGAGATNFLNSETIFFSFLHSDYDDISGLAIAVGRCNYIF